MNQSGHSVSKEYRYACVNVLNNVFALEGNKAITIKRQLHAVHVFIMFNLKIKQQKWT